MNTNKRSVEVGRKYMLLRIVELINNSHEVQRIVAMLWKDGMHKIVIRGLTVDTKACRLTYQHDNGEVDLDFIKIVNAFRDCLLSDRKFCTIVKLLVASGIYKIDLPDIVFYNQAMPVINKPFVETMRRLMGNFDAKKL